MDECFCETQRGWLCLIRLLELDEQRRRAEADKMAAIKALEARSLEFMQEKEEKKRLEQVQ